MRKAYEVNIEDVAMEISVANEWRKKIFDLEEGGCLEISYRDEHNLPKYIREDVVNNKLIFYVQKVESCPEEFDDGLIIFKFWAKGYEDICRYSGNNPDVV